MTVQEFRKALKLAKDQQMKIETAVKLLEVLPLASEVKQDWDEEARRILGWDKPIVLPMPKGRGARRG